MTRSPAGSSVRVLARAVIDRQQLRRGLQDLAAEESRVLIVTGEPGAGKSHSWRLIAHLQQAVTMATSHRFVRVTTHDWAGEVSGEDLALRVADRLGPGDQPDTQ